MFPGMKLKSEKRKPDLVGKHFIERSLSPLTSLQKNILERLGVGASAYEQLEITESTFPFSKW